MDTRKAALKPISSMDERFCRKLQALFSDIDDTLTIDGKIPSYVIDALYELADAGVRVFFVTGRPAAFGLALENYFGFLEGVIVENGGALCTGGNIETLAKIGDTNEYRADLLSIYRKLCDRFGTLPTSVGNEFRITDLAIDRRGIDDGRTAEIAAYAVGLGANSVFSSIQIHIFKHRMDKGKAVNAVCRRFGIQRDRIMTIGDSPNDEPLFAFERSVGVANVLRYLNRLAIKPAYITNAPKALGALELIREILRKRRG